MAPAKAKPQGISAGGILPTEEFCARMGWGRKAFVAARRRGLPVHKQSRRLYIVTDEAVAWLKSQSTAGGIDVNQQQLQKTILDLAAIDSEGQLTDLLTDHSAECRKLGLLPDRENRQPAADFQAKEIGRALEQLFGIPATAAEASARDVLRQHPRRDLALDLIADYRCRTPKPEANASPTEATPKPARRRAW